MSIYLIYAGLSAIGIAISGSILGCFIVWRRMAYFGEAIAHSSILGVVLGLFFSINLNLTIILSSLIFCLLLIFFERRNLFPIDSSLGVLAHGFLALGIILLSLQKTVYFNLEAYLFGDILTVSGQDILFIYVVLIFSLLFILFFWQKMLLFSLSPELAKVEGINTNRLNIIFTILIAILISVSIRSVGLLLVVSMIIMPATSARIICYSAKSMLLLSVILSLVSVLLGLTSSHYFDLPTGPAIVTSSFIILLLLLIINLFVGKFSAKSLLDKK